MLKTSLMENLRIFAGILILLTSAQISFGQKADTTKKASPNNKSEQNSHRINKDALPANFTYNQLNNGLDVLIVQDSTVPLVSLEMAFKNGAITEPESWDGINAIYEKMYFGANQDYPSQKAIDKRSEELGIEPEAETGLERTNYYFTLHKNQLPYGLAFLKSATLNPKLFKGRVNEARKEQLAQLQSALKSPEFRFEQDLKRKLWQERFSRKNIHGHKESLKNITKEDISELRYRYFYPNNGLLVVAGDVNVSETLRLIRQIFGKWESSGLPIFKKYWSPKFDKLNRTRSFLTKDNSVDTPGLVFAFHGPDRENKKTAVYAAKVFTEMVNRPNSSFKQKLAEEDLVFQADVNYQSLHNVGHFFVHLKPKPENIKETGQAFEEYLPKWGNPDYHFSKEQLEEAKQSIANQIVYNRAKPSENIHKISKKWAFTGIEHYGNLKDSILAVTLSDIQQFVKQYLQNSKHVRGALVSPEQKKQSDVGDVAREIKPIEEYAALYALNSSEITDSADIATVRDIEYIMRINQNAQLTVHGYTDYTGPSWYNEQLSKERAKAAKQLIVEWGRVSGNRIETIGHGEREKTNDPEERQKDRSARFSVTFPKSDQ